MGRATVVGGKVGMKEPISLPPIGTALNDFTWEQIRMISDTGRANEYFSVGDCKEIILNGTIGKLTLSNYNTCAFIIGIDHNANIEGTNRIHFQLAKTALSDSIDIALCDNAYNSTASTIGYFSMNGNDSNTGGWKSSSMRTDICGTSLTNYSGTIIGAIPEELRVVLKPVIKYTDNTGTGIGNIEVNVTETNDYIFLLSEYEVFGYMGYGNTYEFPMQQQYAYYTAGNSRIKYEHRSPSSAAVWWLRSPDRNTTNCFSRIFTDGSINRATANGVYAISPAFCV